MPDSTALVRQWKLLTSLAARTQGVTVKEMTQEHGCNIKTIRRDLLLLQRVGFPIEEKFVSGHGRKHWQLVDAAGRPPLGFNLTEMLSLYLARLFLEPLAGTQFWDGANSAFSKIRASLTENVLGYLEKLASVLRPTSLPVGDYSRKTELIDQLMISIEDSKTTFIEYQSARATEIVSIELNPLGIIWHRGSLYLVADSRDHGGLRHFKVDRINEVEVTNFPFKRPVDFDLSKHLDHSFGILHGEGPAQLVRILFSRDVAQYVSEKSFHPSQKLLKQRDGRMVAEYTVDDLREIKSWLLSFGRHAEVLEPAGLIADLRTEIAALSEIYSLDGVRSLRPVGKGLREGRSLESRLHAESAAPRRTRKPPTKRQRRPK